ncbi:SAM-dependent methyltransferase [Streptomyces europaeiscabiei]|uniref:SAM-dependent methyltransferase n=1 Tax=Streptomyces europaeiscabiei TaxID=146819 RepID=UPI0029B3B763|nr:SAM-dependent methyltransferase [Streptomyces europaeiscabiei]MDX3584684.1 SAM-dependent methyltransferase [Streptomyces europaeiscabiei]
MTVTKRPPAAQTALGPMVIAACEQHLPESQRVLSDELAVQFLPPGLRLVTGACRWRPVRDLLTGATDKKALGLWASVLSRKRYADDKVSEAVRAGIEQFVFLGAGLDTRAYRLVPPTGARAFEIDLPANIAHKRQRLNAVFGRVPDHVFLVPVDFQTDDLADVLHAHGFAPEIPTMFVWEAVTQYLTEDGVRRTLAFLAKAAIDSRLIFTYVRKDFLDGIDFYGAAQAHQDFVVEHAMWHFGLAPEDTRSLLQEYGWAEREQVGSREYLARYVRPTGRDLPVSEIERFVSGEKV